MCLIVFAWRPGSDYPLLMAANRDEFHSRAATPMGWWEDTPYILGGRDLEAGGTWLGISTKGRFAAVTNIRDPQAEPGAAPRSRGELTREFLAGTMAPDNYLSEVSQRIGSYHGFNLLVGTRDSFWYLHGNVAVPTAPLALQPGIYGLSNAALDVPWPKVETAKKALRANMARSGAPSISELLSCVSDRSPAPTGAAGAEGVEGDLAQRLSAQFIVTPVYGTRCSTAMRWHRSGRVTISEVRFDANGQAMAEDRFDFNAG